MPQRFGPDIFERLRADPFGGRLTRGQIEGLDSVFGHWRCRPAGDPRHLAYMLATAFHETGRTMQPMRETGATSDAAAIARLEAAFAAGRLRQVKTPYWRPDPTGRSWFGRGLVQITHRRNYQRLSAAIGIDLVADPARAMEMAVAVRILFAGMEQGLFSGVTLSDVFNATTEDWIGARRIVNGTDRAEKVAGYGRAFLAGILG